MKPDYLIELLNLTYEKAKRETAKEILQNLYYFSDGHSFRTEETGDYVELNKVDDILVFIEEEARKYKVEVET